MMEESDKVDISWVRQMYEIRARKTWAAGRARC